MTFRTKPKFNVDYSDSASKTLQCIFAVQQEVTVEEGGENTQGARYRYARLDDMQYAIRSYLLEYRCIYLFGTDFTEILSGFVKVQGRNDATPRDKLMTSAFWSGTITLVSIDDPKDFVRVSGYGFKVDQSSDKSLGAVTIGKRYLLASLFGFTTGDDPDDNDSDVRRMNAPDKPSKAPSTVADFLS